MRLIPYALSDVGRKRQHNEDSYLVAPQLSLFAVADGMGGHRAGEKASRMAVERLRDSLIPPKRSAGKDEVLAHLQKAMYITGA
ncbi:MAG TPA: protein phosphatase 2C domain-containing protein, partial [Pseudomonadota bacterium]|nr:protein phosphatase 2C domain-containing protein [Pseudomonadota bacterium]